TSWGVTTRLIGALIMTHSDDKGLKLPPKLAPIQVVIVPIYRNEEQFEAVVSKAKEIAAGLKAEGISVKVDDDDTKKPGWKFAEYELKGVPVRLAIGPRDLENNQVELARRDLGTKETIAMDAVVARCSELMVEMQDGMLASARAFRDENIREVETYDEFVKVLDEQGGFISAHWDGTEETEDKVKDETKATIRCIPLEGDKTPGKCMVTGKPSERRVIFARAY
ncbi:MAG: proline--tRNA ligase, partial [Flavobacteriales bacterium]|nr:proline--tRNA ligase [Flavobacteriales bacterium]